MKNNSNSPPQQTEITDKQKLDAPAANRSGTTQKNKIWFFPVWKKRIFLPQRCFFNLLANKFAGENLDEAVIYKIKLPKGTHAIDAMGISRKPEEWEILLPPTGKFNIERVYYEKDSAGNQTRQIVEVTYGI